MSDSVHQPSLPTVQLAASHRAVLASLFARIVADPSGSHFHPHPFTNEEAARICLQAGKDLYFGMLQGDALVAYGMLRGWNEGFAIPSLGIYVAPEMRGTGAARNLMRHLHDSAKLAGARRIRLKVHVDNGAARKLYVSLGYQLETLPQPDGQLLGFFDIPSD